MTWNTLVVGYLAIFGILIGSFLNVVIYRVPAGLSLIPASRCPTCTSPIRPWQNIPVVSWIILRGRCAKCKGTISPRYPLVELATALVFAGITWWWLPADIDFATLRADQFFMLLIYLYFAAISIVLALIDIDTQRLPNVIVLPSALVIFALLGAVALITSEGEPLLRALMAGLALFLGYGILWFLGGMGLGDVKLSITLGLLLGWLGWGTLIVGTFAGFILGAIYGVILLLVRRSGRKTRIPFGPWMLVGTWLGLFAGETVSNWYIDTFFM